jgi:subtilisin family serine protease
MRAGLALAAVLALVLAPAAQARPLDKLDARLKGLATGKIAKGKATAGPSVQPAGAPVRDGKVQVDVYVRGAMRDGAAALRAEGMRVEAISGRSPERVVEGSVPVARLDDVAALHNTRAVVAVQEPIYNTGSATSEGDVKHNAPQVRAQGFTGAGIPVGVMSDSINKRGTGVAGSQATNDLPATVQILDDPGSGTDEGRAMAQIVYDEAPGIPKIIFARGGGGAAIRANNIDALVAAGSKVIADDVVYLSEPFFQDGIVAQAADQAAADGTAYFVSAGNRARQSWEGTFTPSSVPAENDFDTGAGEDRQQTIATVPNGQQLSIFVQWANPFGAVTDDFALDFYNANTSTFLATIDSNNVTTGIPAESAVLNGGGAGATFAVAIRRVSGSGTPRLKWIANGAFTGALPAEHSTNSPAIDPDAASARGAVAVAAVRQNDAGLDTVESFSSRGPTVTRLFSPTGDPLATPDVRSKPDIAGADGVATTTDFDVGSPDLNPFFGTSAAAPSVAGVVALLWSAKPSLSLDEVYAIGADPRGAIDCTSAPGFPDADCGFGFILADGKLPMVLDSTPPAVSAATSPAAPDGANGWFHSPASLTWDLTDAESPVASTSNCGPQTVTSQGATAFTCTATSAGGTTNQPVTIKRDTVPPSAPVFSGIAPGARLVDDALPAASAIGCSATDATSGIGSCNVTGFASGRGTHTLTATATDQSGLTSTSTLTYSVVGRGASTLKVKGKQNLRTVLKKGFLASVGIGGDKTAIDATLKLGRTTVGRLKKTFDQGTATLKIKINKAGKKKLRGKRSAKLALTVNASGPNVATATVSSSAKLKR